jgi:hypothetical protein
MAQRWGRMADHAGGGILRHARCATFDLVWLMNIHGNR